MNCRNRRMKPYLSLLLIVTILQCQSATSQEREPVNFNCWKTFNVFGSHRTTDEGFLVKCPNCTLKQCPPYRVRGGHEIYNPSSPVCCSAIHNGALTMEGGLVIVHKIHHMEYINKIKGTTRYNITSRDHSPNSVSYSFDQYQAVEPETTTEMTTTTIPTTTTTTIPTTTTTPAAPTTTAKAPTRTTIKTRLTTTTIPSTIEESTTNHDVIKHHNDVIKPHQTSTSINQLSTTSYQIENGEVGDHRRSENDEEISTNNNSNDQVKWTLSGAGMGIGFVLVILIAIIGGRKVHKMSRQQRSGLWSRVPNRRKKKAEEDGGCVCYIAMDSSTQGLMHDPETCDRPCSKKKELIAAQEIIENEGCENHCDDCTGDKCAQNNERFDF